MAGYEAWSGRDAVYLVRVARSLKCNKVEDVVELTGIVIKVLCKIIDEPTEAKYRSLRPSAKALATKVLSRPGGRELLGAVGFKSSKEAVDDSIVLDSSVDGAALRGAVAWINALVEEQINHPPDVELNIRLPSGASLRAAFSRSETIRDVLSYVDEVAKDSHALKTTHPVRDLTQDPDASLLDAGLCPRAALIATSNGALGAAATSARSMDEARRRDEALRLAEKRSRDEADRRLRGQKLDAKRDVVEQRARALNSFGDDRESKQEQLERARRSADARKARAEADAEAKAERAKQTRALLLAAEAQGRRPDAAPPDAAPSAGAAAPGA
ncbi:hypothetical protein M885DRAFT_545926 [Pelagophyceae sp. CCMP2097]|nr:hypothetical protein M885DRAFT_545926 [Pelagophyceae sp. CCMP2097]